MAYRKICSLAVGVLLMAAGSARADAPLSMAEAVRLALAHNERSLQAPLRTEAAEGQLDRARSAFLPTLTAQGTGQVSAPQAPKTAEFPVTGSATLQVPILNLSAIPLYKQAKHALESERWGAAQDQRQLVFDTAKAFLSAIAAEHLLTAAQERYDHAKATEDDTAARVAAQLNSTNDVTRASLETATARGAVIQAQGNVSVAYLQLGFLVGQSVTGPLAPADSTTEAAQRKVYKIDDVIRAAEARRPDVRSSEEKSESMRQFAEEPLYRLAPTLTATGQFKQQVNPVAPDTGRSESVLLNLTWTIYDGGARYGDRRTRVAQAQEQEYDEKLLRRSIATDVNVALESLRAARAAYVVSAASVAIADRNNDETAILYKQGLARAIEVTDANATRFDAEVSLENAKLGMEQAYLALRFALGLDPIGTETNAAGAPAATQTSPDAVSPSAPQTSAPTAAPSAPAAAPSGVGAPSAPPANPNAAATPATMPQKPSGAPVPPSRGAQEKP